MRDCIDMIVSDSSPIINFGKQGVLDILKKCFGKVIIPRAVYDEIIIKKESVEVKSLEKYVSEGWITIEETAINPILNTQNLGNGEKEAISLASNQNSVLLIDDNIAKSYASLLGVECHGTIWAIYISILKGFMDKEKARKLLEAMIREGFYVSTEIYVGFINRLETM